MITFTLTAQAVADRKARQIARIQRNEAAYKEANGDKAPTMDCNGRAHAPCNGYIMPAALYLDYRGDYDGYLFAAGEYLPEPIDTDIAGPTADYDFTRRVKMPVQDIQILKEMKIDDLEVGQGAPWTDGEIEIAYAYLKGKKSLIMAVEADATNHRVATAPLQVYLEGRQTIIGTIVATKFKDTLYGMTQKMMVLTKEGHKLWGTVPKALEVEEKGMEISLTATFTKGNDGMSFFSRPVAKPLH